jgi:hypothetical protein
LFFAFALHCSFCIVLFLALHCIVLHCFVIVLLSDSLHCLHCLALPLPCLS